MGTSSFSHESWVGSFYPAGTKPADFLTLYAKRYDTVEIDATFYRTPSKAQARSWASKVPDGFKIALKAPQVVTHKKMLLDCDEEMKTFLEACDEMGDRLGPILFQFQYFRKDTFASVNAFLARLTPFLETLPPGRPYALEVRNRGWVGAALLDLLRRHRIAYALVDHPWMPPADEISRKLDVVTSGFAYVRWLGDRKGIEARTDSWDKLIVDRTAEMERWASTLAALLERDIELFGYFNNHYAGHAPGSIELLRRVWRERLGGAAAAP